MDNGDNHNHTVVTCHQLPVDHVGHLAPSLSSRGQVIDGLHRIHSDRLHCADLEGRPEPRVRGLETSLDNLKRTSDNGSGGSSNAEIEQYNLDTLTHIEC